MLTEYQKVIHELSERIVAAQKPIRVLDALKWDEEIKGQFFKHKCKNLPPVTLEYYEKHPQFIRPEYGSIAVQAVATWLIIAATQLGVYGSVVVGAHGVRRWMALRPQTGVVVARVVGVVLMLGAVYAGISSWRRE